MHSHSIAFTLNIKEDTINSCVRDKYQKGYSVNLTPSLMQSVDSAKSIHCSVCVLQTRHDVSVSFFLVYKQFDARCCVVNLQINRGVTIRYPHDTIRIAILESRYDTYRDTW